MTRIFLSEGISLCKDLNNHLDDPFRGRSESSKWARYHWHPDSARMPVQPNRGNLLCCEDPETRRRRRPGPVDPEIDSRRGATAGEGLGRRGRRSDCAAAPEPGQRHGLQAVDSGGHRLRRDSDWRRGERGPASRHSPAARAAG